MLTTWYSMRPMGLKPRSLGTRTWMGVWPPSNQAGMRGAGAGLLALGAAAGGLALAGGDAATDADAPVGRARRRARRSWSFTACPPGHRWRHPVCASVSGDLLDGHQVAHGAHHAPGDGVIAMHDRVPDAVQAEGPDRAAGTLGGADGALAQRDAQLTGHRFPP